MNKQARELPVVGPETLNIGPELWAEAPPGCVLRRGSLTAYHSDIVVLHHQATDFVTMAPGQGFRTSTFHSLCEIMEHLLDHRATPDAYVGSPLHHMLTTENMD